MVRVRVVPGDEERMALRDGAVFEEARFSRLRSTVEPPLSLTLEVRP